uniref:DB domain-containing protein n=1 Tax=Rhabditophanes sp. KR3021 TaxID=114890 RepID=A0AC35TVN4_9BILA
MTYPNCGIILILALSYTVNARSAFESRKEDVLNACGVDDKSHLTLAEKKCVEVNLWKSSFITEHGFSCCNLFDRFGCGGNCRKELGDPFGPVDERIRRATICELPDPNDISNCMLSRRIAMVTCFGTCLDVQKEEPAKNVTADKAFTNRCMDSIDFAHLQVCVGGEVD